MGSKWFFKPFDWPRELYSNIKDWYLIRTVCKEKESIRSFKEFEPELRVDNIGRIYTVVNIPEEMYDKKFAQVRQTYFSRSIKESGRINFEIRYK